MKKVQLFLLFVISLAMLSPTTFAQSNRKKVAVVLSGGGAKGVAHIKALQIIEEAGIPIDYVVGTSMGSIIGGLYSIGYTPQQMDSMVTAQNWEFLLSDKIKRSEMSLTERESSEKYVISVPFKNSAADIIGGGLIRGRNLANLFSKLTVGYHDSIDFNNLPIPYACVASNIVDGKPVVFHSGVLSNAMRSSMSIPGVFTPVRIGDMVLVDGGLMNNFPVDIARSMGADYVIGVDVQSGLRSKEELNTTHDIIGQIINIECQSNYEKNVALTDVHIKVDVKGYSSSSFNIPAIDTLMNRGYVAAQSKWGELLALKEKLNLPIGFKPEPHGPYSFSTQNKTIFINKIAFSEVSARESKWLLKKCGLREYATASMEDIENTLTFLRSNQRFSGVSYRLDKIGNDEGYNLTFLINEQFNRKINVGIRFDSEEIATVLVNARGFLKTSVPSELSLSARLGKRYGAKVDYILSPVKRRDFIVEYEFMHNDLDIYDDGDRSYNVVYDSHIGRFGFSDVWIRNLRFGLGLNLEYYHYKDLLFKEERQDIHVKSDTYFNYYADIEYNNLDKGYFPTKGSALRADYMLHTDNFYNYDGKTPFSELKVVWKQVIPITNRFAILPSIYSRMMFGGTMPHVYDNCIGGEGLGMYTPQQLPFAGVVNTEIVDDKLAIGSIKFRQRMGNIHYISLNSSFGFQHDDLSRLFKKQMLFGVSAEYGLDTMFGPINATLGYSNRTKKVSFYLNMGFLF